MFYSTKKGFTKVIIGGVVATLAITAFMSLFNYFVLFTSIWYIMDLADITKNVKTIVTAGIIPFNLLKGALVTFLFFVTIKVYENIPTTIKARFS